MFLFSMGWFGRKKEIVDLGERYRKRQEQTERIREVQTSSATKQEPSVSPFSLFDTVAVNPTASSGSSNFSGDESANERRRKLVKRLKDMTEKMEELSNQIYHLQQRIEVLERKAGVGGF